jgi:hypothetical protein
MKIKTVFVTSCVFVLSACTSGNYSRVVEKTPPEVEVLRHLYHLSSDDMSGRKVATEGNIKAQQYIIKALSKLDIQPFNKSLIQPFSFDDGYKQVIGHNIVGVIPGVSAQNKYIVLSAHFDHIGGKGKRIYNGADDNASGTAALLDFAQRLKAKPLRYNVILLFTDAEESNLKGAKAFIKDNTRMLGDIILNINVDMIAGNKKTKRLHYISRGTNDLLSGQAQLDFINNFKNAEIKVKKGFINRNVRTGRKIKWEIASDHGVFYREKIPFIYFGVGTHNNYHQTSDTFDNINQSFYTSVIEIIYQQLLFLDQNI